MNEKEKAALLDGIIEKRKPDNPKDTKFSETILSRAINLENEYPDIEYFLNINGVGFCPKSEIIALKAKAKSGKTTTELILTAAMKKGRFCGIESKNTQAKILFFDTEQSVTSTYKFVKRLHHICGWHPRANNPDFLAMNLRGDETSKRMAIIEEAIKEYAPDLVFIDGIKDLVFDINNQIEATNIITILLRITKDYGCSLVCVLHENKADTNLRGSIGTELLNKCAECWQIKKDGNIFTAEQTECRNQPAEGFSFTIGASGIPEEIIHEKAIPKSEQNILKKAENFRSSMQVHVPISYGRLKKIYAETAGLSEKTAELHISYAIKHSWIERTSTGDYVIKPTQIPY